MQQAKTLTHLSWMEFPTGLFHFFFKGCWVIFFIFIQILIEHSVSKQWRSRSDTISVAYDLGLHCLPMPHKKDARLIYWLTLRMLGNVSCFCFLQN